MVQTRPGASTGGQGRPGAERVVKDVLVQNGWSSDVLSLNGWSSDVLSLNGWSRC